MNRRYKDNKRHWKKCVLIVSLLIISILIFIKLLLIYQSSGILLFQNVIAKENQAERTQVLVIKNITHESSTKQTETDNVQESKADSMHIIKDFPTVLQNPELPTGCEITALTMVLNYYGFTVDKLTMAQEYLPKTDAGLYYGTDGLLYGNDLEQFFIGNPFSQDGITCGTEAMATAADKILSDSGDMRRAKILKDVPTENLYEYVNRDIPVVILATISMEDRWETQGWYTENGDYVEWSQNDHGVVLVGYTERTVYVADPISGMMEYSKEQFERVYESRGKNGLIIQ